MYRDVFSGCHFRTDWRKTRISLEERTRASIPIFWRNFRNVLRIRRRIPLRNWRVRNMVCHFSRRIHVLNNFLIVIRYHIRSSLWTKKHCLWKREGENEDRRGCGVGSWWLAVPSSSSWRTWADFLLRRSSDRRSMGPYSLSLRGKVSSFSRIAINKRLDLDWKESCGILFLLLVTLTWLGGRYSWGSPEDTLTLILAKSWR